jgi:hypothetical protein
MMILVRRAMSIPDGKTKTVVLELGPAGSWLNADSTPETG